MYFVIKNNIDKNGHYNSGEIMEHTSSGITVALNLLEQNAIKFVKDECGKQNADKIINIHSLDQVAEPLVDGMLLYRVDNNHNIHVYQRISKPISGYVYGKSVIAEFNRIVIFELIDYDKINSNTSASTPHINEIDMIKVGSVNVKIPKSMTLAPICDLLNDLKQSSKFLKFKRDNDLN